MVTLPVLQTKLFISSEVPIYHVFSDDSSNAEMSDHMRSVMDDLVSPFPILFSVQPTVGADTRPLMYARMYTGSSPRSCWRELHVYG